MRYVVKTLMRFAAFVSLLLGLVLATASPVSAECVSPTIEIEQPEVVRGGELVISGYAFGETCYDTGPPPQGQRELGLPLTEIEIYIVQGTNETLVATGAADAFYKFTVTIVVPLDLVPGVAEVQARWGERVAFSEDPEIVVTDAAPLLPTATPVVTFVPLVTFVPRPSTITYPPDPQLATDPPSGTVTKATEVLNSTTGDNDRTRAGSSSVPTLLIGGAGALVCLLLAIAVVRRRA